MAAAGQCRSRGRRGRDFAIGIHLNQALELSKPPGPRQLTAVGGTLRSGRWLRASGGSVAHRAATHIVSNPASCSPSVSWSWFPRTRIRSPGQFRTSRTSRRSRHASGWATSPRQMIVSSACTRRLHSLVAEREELTETGLGSTARCCGRRRHRQANSVRVCSPTSRRVASLRPRSAGLTALTSAPRTARPDWLLPTMPTHTPPTCCGRRPVQNDALSSDR